MGVRGLTAGMPSGLRHFVFSADTQPNHAIPFETSQDVFIDGSIVIPTGSLAVAFMEQASDVKEFGRGAEGQIRFKYVVLPNGTKLPLRGFADFRGKSLHNGLLIAATLAFGVGPQLA
jgi:hypothetical protein